jgi:hypothetical protein
MNQAQYFQSLTPEQQQKLFDFWFMPWQYAHPNHHQGLFAEFEQKTDALKNQGYMAYCQHFHLLPLLESFNLKWFEIHVEDIYQDFSRFKMALEMLGLMSSKRLKSDLKADTLRWCYQNSLARPIIFKQEVPTSQAFELGMVIFHQMIQNFAQATWSRLCLAFPPDVKIKYSQAPLFSAPMLLIIQKHWLKILLYLNRESFA